MRTTGLELATFGALRAEARFRRQWTQLSMKPAHRHRFAGRLNVPRSPGRLQT
jgi:hypothetical protein